MSQIRQRIRDLDLPDHILKTVSPAAQGRVMELRVQVKFHPGDPEHEWALESSARALATTHLGEFPPPYRAKIASLIRA